MRLLDMIGHSKAFFPHADGVVLNLAAMVWLGQSNGFACRVMRSSNSLMTPFF